MNPLRALFLSLSRMPPAVMLVVIVGLAVVVTIMVTGKVNEQETAFKARTAELETKMSQKGKVVYTIKDIPEGQSIPTEALEEREIEQSKIPQDAITSASLAAGRVAKYGIATGTIVSQHDLAPQGISLGFEARLKEGMRAVTFGIDNNTGVAGFVQPESHVDIMAIAGAGPDTKAQPILSDVEIIAVGQVFQKTPAGQATPASSVTVAVAPEDAQKLIKAINAGKLYLTLRNDKDHTPVATVDVTTLYGKPNKGPGNDLAALPPPSALPPPPLPGVGGDASMGGPGALPAAPPPPPPLHEIEIWSGSKKDVLSVPKS